MNFKVVDEHGRMLSGGRNLDQLKAKHGRQAQASFQKVAARDDQIAQALAHEKLTDWTFGPLPEIMEIKRKGQRSEEHTSELQSLMRISYAVFCLKTKNAHNIRYAQRIGTIKPKRTIKRSST